MAYANPVVLNVQMGCTDPVVLNVHWVHIPMNISHLNYCCVGKKPVLYVDLILSLIDMKYWR